MSDHAKFDHIINMALYAYIYGEDGITWWYGALVGTIKHSTRVHKYQQCFKKVRKCMFWQTKLLLGCQTAQLVWQMSDCYS